MIAEDVAVRAALAVDNVRLYREAQDQAATHIELNEALRDRECRPGTWRKHSR
jgi:hypothetical protein